MASLSAVKTMSDAQIQAWLRRVGQANVPSLVMALLGADETVRACVLRNMSPRAGAQLRKEIEAQQAGPLRAAVIEKCTAEMEKLLG